MGLGPLIASFAAMDIAAFTERLKRNITFDLLSEELTHFEQRMRVDRGAEPLCPRRERLGR